MHVSLFLSGTTLVTSFQKTGQYSLESHCAGNPSGSV